MKSSAEPALGVVLAYDDDARAEACGRMIAISGLDWSRATTYAALRGILAKANPGAVVLQRQLGTVGCLWRLKEVREGRPDLTIVMADVETALDRTLALELGADDVLSAPTDPRELASRLRARIAARPPRQGSDLADLRMDAWNFDARAGTICRVGNSPRALTAREIGFLTALLARPGEPVSRPVLAEAGGLSDRALDGLVHDLRRKFDTDGEPSCIATVRGRGYRFAARLES